MNLIVALFIVIFLNMTNVSKNFHSYFGLLIPSVYLLLFLRGYLFSLAKKTLANMDFLRCINGEEIGAKVNICLQGTYALWHFRNNQIKEDYNRHFCLRILSRTLSAVNKIFISDC